MLTGYFGIMSAQNFSYVYLSNWISRRNRSDVPRMDVNENRERREGELLRAEIRENAGAHEESDAGGHRGESR